MATSSIEQDITKLEEDPHTSAVDVIATRPKALENSLLRKLPDELIQHIASWMPLSAAAAFSLSCLALRNIVGTEYITRVARIARKCRESNNSSSPVHVWSSFSNDHHESCIFVEALARDLPHHVGCFDCLRLHIIISENTAAGSNCRSGKKVPEPACKIYDRMMELRNSLGQRFENPLFQMMMKWCPSDIHFGALRALLSVNPYEKINWTWSPIGKTKPSALMRIISPPFKVGIVEGSLFVQRQLIVPILSKPMESIQLKMCDHLMFGWETRSDEVVVISVELRRKDESTVELEIRSDHGHLKHRCEPILRCPDCFTSYRIIIDEHTEGTLAICTVWSELGHSVGSDPWNSIFDPRPFEGKTPLSLELARKAAARFDQEEMLALDSGLCPKDVKSLFRAAGNRSWIRRAGGGFEAELGKGRPKDSPSPPRVIHLPFIWEC